MKPGWNHKYKIPKSRVLRPLFKILIPYKLNIVDKIENKKVESSTRCQKY